MPPFNKHPADALDIGISPDQYQDDIFTGFEGPEKLLEIWFTPSPYTDGTELPENPTVRLNQDLRSIPLEVITEMLDIVHCKILNTTSNEYFDSYVLSESSLFVYPHKMVLKTCGTTTLLLAVPKILRIASEYCGYSVPYRAFYSRKSFMFPKEQVYPHTDWNHEVSFLNQYFENGSHYMIGGSNSDQWFLYLTTPNTASGSLMNLNPNGVQQSGLNGVPHHKDTTVEILMTKLDPKTMEKFYIQPDQPEGAIGGRNLEKVSGIDKIYPEAIGDSYMFNPCGFSMNGLQGEHYFTYHVTPEEQCSYASFETNIPMETLTENGTIPLQQALQKLISQVTDVFNPGKFSVTVFESQPVEEHLKSYHLNIPKVPKYAFSDRILYQFPDYSLRYAHFIRE
jgi:S-adenosylmethionine decarboxylase